MALGHDWSDGVPLSVLVDNEPITLSEICNGGSTSTVSNQSYGGFSIWDIDINTDNIAFLLNYVDSGDYNYDQNLGSLIAGKYYTMKSPEIDIKLSVDMDGTKKTRTPGGIDVVNNRYHQGPNWGPLAAW